MSNPTRSKPPQTQEQEKNANKDMQINREVTMTPEDSLTVRRHTLKYPRRVEIMRHRWRQ